MRLIFCLLLLLLPVPLGAQSLRLATWGAPFGGQGPGLLLQDITRQTPAILAAVEAIQSVAPDLLVLTAFDFDADGRAAAAFAALCGFEVALSLPSRAGWPSGQDRDGDGRWHEAEDAESYGRFAGAGAIALFAHQPLTVEEVFSEGAGIWRVWGESLPDLLVGSLPMPLRPFEAEANARGMAALSAELALRPAIFLGRTQLDPEAGRGSRAAMAALAPDPAPPTAFWPSGQALRIDYILDFRGAEQGIFGQEEAALGAGPRASLLWLDLPPQPHKNP